MIIDNIQVTKGLIIDTPWIDYILSGDKIWEMRSTATKIRGTIALIQKGTGNIVGLATLTDSLPEMTIEELVASQDKHKVDYLQRPELQKWNKPWVLNDARRIPPTRYTHKQGAVIWVNL